MQIKGKKHIHFVVCGSLVKYKLIIVCKKFGIVCTNLEKVSDSRLSQQHWNVTRDLSRSTMSTAGRCHEIEATFQRKNILSVTYICSSTFSCQHSLDIVPNSQVSMHFHGIINSKTFLHTSQMNLVIDLYGPLWKHGPKAQTANKETVKPSLLL